MKIKVGQVGIGTWGQNHCQLLAAMPDIDLVGLHDINFKRFGATALDFGTKEFQDLGRLIAEIDALVITAPTHQHFEIARQALERQRHVFVEKPICAGVTEARALVELARKQNVVLQVGHIERFNPAFLALKQIPLTPVYVEARRLSPYSPRGNDVSVVLDLMIHDLDIVLTLVKSALVSVHASGFASVSPTADFANARLEFANGAIANVTASRISDHKLRQVAILENYRRFQIDFLARKTKVFGSDGSPAEALQFDDEAASFAINPLLDQLQSFLSCVRNSTRPEVDGLEGLRALELAERIVEIIDA